MKINKGFKYRLNPTKEQKQMLLQHAGNTRFLWNSLLANNIKYYQEQGKFNFGYSMVMSLPELKENFPFLKLSFSQSLQTVGRQLNEALTKFIKHKSGFPKFKKKNLEKDSFHCPQSWEVSKKYVKIPKIGKIKWIKHRSLQGKPKSITITQDGNQWFCSVLCEINIKEKEFKTDKIIGIDVGLKEFAVLSDKTVVKRQRFTKKYEEKLQKEQRRLSRKEKGSKNKLKQKKKVQKVHKKIKNSRKDFLNKTVHDMITKYDGFCLENLNVSGMLKNHKLAKSIGDVSWYNFKTMLKYKSIWNFKYFVEIDRWFPSTKECFQCGERHVLDLEDRILSCQCGWSADRDWNASLKILEEGLNTLGQRGINVCGDEKVHDFVIRNQVIVNKAEKRISA